MRNFIYGYESLRPFRTLIQKCFVAGVCLFAFYSAIQAQRADKPVRCLGVNGLTASGIAEILAVHNAARAELGVGKLTWNCKLADYAQQWATRGVYEHRSDYFYGESIFVTSAVDAAPSAAVWTWLSERPNWDNKNGVCRPDKTCTHFTQVIWKKTTNIGCGINRTMSGKYKVFLVCNYDPPGNSSGTAY